MHKQRSKNLGDSDVKKIVEMLDGWSGKLTWALLIDAIELRLFNCYTRQALFRHERIRNAYELKKNEVSIQGKVRPVKSHQFQIASDRIAKLQSENKRLESENHQLLEQFARWAYNAYGRGLSLDFLNRPLPPVNRGQTRR